MKKRLNIICIALLALFMSHYCGATLFFHTHELDGRLVSHSHPYAPTSHHTHSTAGFQLIESLSSLLFTLSVICTTMLVLDALYIIVTPKQTQQYAIYGKHCPLRAPPVC